MSSVAGVHEGIECHLEGFYLIYLPITLTLLAAGDYWPRLAVRENCKYSGMDFKDTAAAVSDLTYN